MSGWPEGTEVKRSADTDSGSVVSLPLVPLALSSSHPQEEERAELIDNARGNSLPNLTKQGMMMASAVLLTVLLLVVVCRTQVLDGEELLPKDCGRSYPTLSTVIIGGKNANPGQFPWIGLIGYRIKDDPRSNLLFGCDGSLITSRHFITAAHCLHEDSLRAKKSNGEPVVYTPVRVRMGDHDITTEDDGPTTDYNVAQVIIHEGWNNRKKLNDIGILKLEQTVQFTSTIQPICLPPDDLLSKSLVGNLQEVAGWGMMGTDTNAKKATILQTVKVEVVDRDKCRTSLKSLRFWSSDLQIDDSVFCAGASGKDSCKGDSGGPLMYTYEPLCGEESSEESKDKSRIVLMGIVSYGYSCGLEGYPGVYTNVSNHMPWIMQHLKS